MGLLRLKQTDDWPLELDQHHLELLGAVLGPLGLAGALEVVRVLYTRFVRVTCEEGDHAANTVPLDIAEQRDVGEIVYCEKATQPGQSQEEHRLDSHCLL